jgi:hypothetical protein
MDAFYKGDSIELEFTLFKDKANSEYWDLTDWQVLFVLICSTTIKKATANVSSGSDEQIKVLNATQGTFLVSILPEETVNLSSGDYVFGIQVRNISENKKVTVVKDFIRISESGLSFE